MIMVSGQRRRGGRLGRRAVTAGPKVAARTVGRGHRDRLRVGPWHSSSSSLDAFIRLPKQPNQEKTLYSPSRPTRGNQAVGPTNTR
jgi:hypothetical protein